ncbi:hypothetical protein JCM9140_2985 [Halalkalibacter wakoensis JCM 9140]|uniref:HTH cro/C1-type domain-containing protein n=1 Tax=Halalkalibacter wakoensis JCM 9140 TaxID=1236970 RepID=W4Q4J8_9BACI|nr:hypothetical protein [Halalkalibacter wakoensis]GAE26880.1 hypothetical protein JCM9140_2985 [Halalkalibacter wakoensis JCM 9140]
MYIGDVLKERMDCFNMSGDELCEEALIDADDLKSILNNEVSYDKIDELTISFISQVLYCKPEYFISEQYRDNDLVKSCLNRGSSTPKSNEVKGILQGFSEDLSFLMELKRDLEEGI